MATKKAHQPLIIKIIKYTVWLQMKFKTAANQVLKPLSGQIVKEDAQRLSRESGMLFICALTPLSRLFVSPRRCKEKSALRDTWWPIGWLKKISASGELTNPHSARYG